ncbi:hypothetical protein [Acidianus hospitalis]|uniref:DUF190 domain-containing protein n=1 Tax=Acidianus hospitalis (strain W1) TaxID=933801 RepID=F4B4B8_ACIHW|nr:hypothetical protein [Acidianus hospitalis]AEE94226.1 conserved hypothetical protein [Acidianus hospitalis W1]
MFSVKLLVLEDPGRLRDVFYSIEGILANICKPIRLGASYICSVSKNTLISAYLSGNLKNFQLIIEIESEDAEELTTTLDRIINELKSKGIHITLFNTSTTSL